MASLTEPAKLLLLITLLAKDKIISNNGKAFMKELILRRDPRLATLIDKFEKKDTVDMGFLEEVHNLIGAEAQALYDDLFAHTSLEVGKTLSKREREEKALSQEKSLIYGEVEFESFYRILRKINPESGGVFYDLGSGTGKAVFAARLTRDFDRCVGVEILTSLHQAAEVVVRRYNENFKSFLSLSDRQTVAVYEGSFCDFDWSDGDLVFANSTCFSDELMAQVSQLAGRLKPGAIVVTFTKGLSSPMFELLERRRYGMSWGPATVFIHRRLNAQGQSVGPARLNVLPSDEKSYEDDYETNVRPSQSGSYSSNKNGSNGNVHYDLADIDEGDEDDEDEDEDEEEDDVDDEEEDEDEEEEEEEENDDEEEDYDMLNNKNSSSLSPSKIYPEDVLRSSATKTTFPSAMNSASKAPSLQSTQNTQTLRQDSVDSQNSNSSINKNNVNSDAQDSFNMLNSPMDTMLLLRKRNSQHAHPLPQHSPNSNTDNHKDSNNTSNSNNASPNHSNSVRPPPAPFAALPQPSSASKSSPLKQFSTNSSPKPPTPVSASKLHK